MDPRLVGIGNTDVDNAIDIAIDFAIGHHAREQHVAVGRAALQPLSLDRIAEPYL